MTLTHQRRPRPRLAATVLLATAAFAGAVFTASNAAATAGLGLHQPSAIVAGGGHLWIAERQSDTVTELTTAGHLVRRISARHDDLRTPVALAVAGRRLLVVNKAGSLAELSLADGSLMRLVRGTRYGFDKPDAVVAGKTHAWVLDRAGNSVTEIRIFTGALVRRIGAGTHPGVVLDSPTAITLVHGNLWIVSHAGGAGSLTEVAAASGQLVRVISGGHGHFDSPVGVAEAGGRIWVANSGNASVTELTEAGHVVHVIHNSRNMNYGFNAPTVVTASGAQVYVISPPGASPMITRIDSASADVLWYECNTNVPDPGFANPTGLVTEHGRVWVVSPADDSLAELHARDGSLITRFS